MKQPIRKRSPHPTWKPSTMRTLASIFLACLLSATVQAAPVSIDTSAFGSDGDANLGIGLTYSATTRLYNNPNTVLAPLPYFTANKNGFYINGLNVGYELTADPDPFVAPKIGIRIDILAVPRFLGYKAEESPVLEGLDDTDYSVHGGLSFTLVNAAVGVNVQLLTDLLGESDGSEINATFSRSINWGTFSLTPALGLNWQDEALVDHYYGVNGADATATRSQYSAGATLNASASLTAGYQLSKRLNLFGAVRFDQFGSEITNSPIVDEDSVSSATVGIVFTF